MIIELHLIQNFAPSNLNRDDTNNPKDCEFGGVRRARISSQCLKRSIRHHPVFQQITGVEPSKRTRLIADELAKGLSKRGMDEVQAKKLAETFASYYSSKKSGKESLEKGRTGVLLFLSRAEIETITERLMALGDAADVKKFAEDFAKNNKDRPGAPDIALFGRMLADRPDTNVDAACQVAHAISTHRVTMDIDYFTAVDDLLPQEESGAGMVNVTAFNSACFYRYAAIDFDQLVVNLSGDRKMARKTVEAFFHASVRAVPSGKQNSFAAQNPPSFVMAVVRNDHQSWSLANAFEKPVHANTRKSLTQASIEALILYWKKLCDFYNNSPLAFMVSLEEDSGLEMLKDARYENFDKLVEAVLKALPQE